MITPSTRQRRRSRPVSVAVAFPLLVAGSANACSQSAAPPPTTAAPAPVITLHQLAFNPATLTVRTGTPVRWSWQDGGVQHTVTADDASFDSGALNTGTFSHAFTAAGTFAYHCNIHANMRGTVVVQA